MANFKAFRWVISSSINLLFLKSVLLKTKEMRSHPRFFFSIDTLRSLNKDVNQRQLARLLHFLIGKICQIRIRNLGCTIISDGPGFQKSGFWILEMQAVLIDPFNLFLALISGRKKPQFQRFGPSLKNTSSE